MTTEERLDKLEENYNDKDKQFTAFMAKMDMYINKTDQTIQRLEEFNKASEMKFEAMNSRIDVANNRIDATIHQIRNLTVAAVVGVAAIIVTIILK